MQIQLSHSECNANHNEDDHNTDDSGEAGFADRANRFRDRELIGA